MKPPKPMKAVTYNEKRLVLPCYVQPKLDGVRCLTDGQRFFSRNGNEFHNVDHLRLRYGRRTPAWIDGELYIPGQHLGDIVSVVKREGHPDAETLQFHAFDIVEPRMPFHERLVVLGKIIGTRPWHLVSTLRITSTHDLYAFHDEQGADGGEGTIIRHPNGLYRSGPSPAILKWKFEQDAEFVIVDYSEAKGKDKGTPVFVCRVGPRKISNTFSVRPMGSMEVRRRMWRDRTSLVGQRITVRYAGFTAEGIPFHPRGLSIRNYE